MYDPTGVMSQIAIYINKTRSSGDRELLIKEYFIQNAPFIKFVNLCLIATKCQLLNNDSTENYNF